jgi:hypothetical protein
MSSCAVNRWGPGTTSKKTSQNSESVKEMADRIAKMQAERDRQDKLWIVEEKQELKETNLPLTLLPPKKNTG